MRMYIVGPANFSKFATVLLPVSDSVESPRHSKGYSYVGKVCPANSIQHLHEFYNCAWVVWWQKVGPPNCFHEIRVSWFNTAVEVLEKVL